MTARASARGRAVSFIGEAVTSSQDLDACSMMFIRFENLHAHIGFSQDRKMLKDICKEAKGKVIRLLIECSRINTRFASVRQVLARVLPVAAVAHWTGKL
jgi:hypothetical protein